MAAAAGGGGGGQEPLGALMALLASRTDDPGRLAVDGALDGVRPPPPEERALLAAVGLDPAAYYRAIAGAGDAGGSAGAGGGGRFTEGAALLTARWAEPSLSIRRGVPYPTPGVTRPSVPALLSWPGLVPALLSERRASQAPLEGRCGVGERPCPEA